MRVWSDPQEWIPHFTKPWLPNPPSRSAQSHCILPLVNAVVVEQPAEAANLGKIRQASDLIAIRDNLRTDTSSGRAGDRVRPNSDERGTHASLRATTRLAMIALALCGAEMCVVSGTYEPLVPIQTVTAEGRSAQQRLLSLITDALGARAADCGQFFLNGTSGVAASPEQLRTAVRCLAEHSTRRATAFVALQVQTIDVWLVHGVMVRRDGSLVLYDYAVPFGQPPSYEEQPCASGNIHVVDEGDDVAWIACRRKRR